MEWINIAMIQMIEMSKTFSAISLCLWDNGKFILPQEMYVLTQVLKDKKSKEKQTGKVSTFMN